MTTALSSPPVSDIARLVRQGVAWWLSELAQLLPRRLIGLFGGAADPVVLLTIGPGGAVLWPTDGRRQAVAASGRRHKGVTIGLDRSLVFEATLDLPRAAEQALPQILQHQIERLVPLGAGKIRFDYRAAPGGDEKLLQVQVFVAKETTIGEALAATRAAGLSPRRIVLADWQGPGKPPALWRADNGADVSRALRRRLEIAALLLAAAAYGLYVHRLDQIRDQLEARIAGAQPAARAVGALGRSLAAVDADAAFFARRGQQEPPLEIIDALTRLVPTNSWLTGLTLDGRRVEISGYSPRASDLVALVERSALFQSPRFSSPITLAPDGKHEHFDLAFETKPAETKPAETKPAPQR
ncbi:MAG TPA: PilN domain-containing protein [Stellaceae bacterium]|jgi:general secretion pathway protein L